MNYLYDRFPVLLFFVVLVLASFSLSDGREFVMNSLECVDHASTCSDLVCKLSGKGKHKKVNFGCTFVNPTSEMNWLVRGTFVKPNIKPYTLVASGDWCDIVNNRIDSRGVKFVMPIISTFMPLLTQPCPMKGRLEMLDYDPNETIALLPGMSPIIPTGDVFGDITVRNNKNQTLIHAKIKWSIKN